MKNLVFLLSYIVSLSVISSCSSQVSDEGPFTQIQTTANFSIEHQSIHGFGGSNAWMSPPSDTSQAKRMVRKLYSRTEGIGLTILRTRIPFRENRGDYRDGFIASREDGSYMYEQRNGAKYFSFNWDAWETSHTRETLSYIDNLGPDGPENLKIMATPWTPPNNWKTGYPDSNLPAYGGRLKNEHYADYADILADFVLGYEKNMGHPILAVSVQNEPDYVPTGYESCGWTSTEIRDFLKILGPRFHQKGVPDSVQILAAESMHFAQNMLTTTLNDPEAASVLDIAGVHQYNHKEEWNTAAKKLPGVEAAKIPLWQTEVSSGDANDSSIKDGLYWAKVIHNDLTIGNINAFLYWWLWSGSNSKGALITLNNGTPLYNKRLYTMGQFSRFVRPGWKRIDTEPRPLLGLSISAFKDPNSNEIAVIIVNEQKKGFELTVSLENISGINELGSWITDAGNDLEITEPPLIQGNSFTQKVPPRSVTTVYGTVGD